MNGFSHQPDALYRDRCLLFITLIIGAISISIPPLWGSSEAREVHVAWSLFHGGSWLLPHRNGIVASKPPFFHWVVALISYPFGEVSPFTARLVSLFAGTFIIYRTMQCARLFSNKIFGVEIENLADRAALNVWIILTTSYGFMVNALDAKVDMLFALCVSLSIFAFYEELLRSNKRFGVLFFAWGSLAVLVKGPLGFILPLWITFCSSCFYTSFSATIKNLLRPNIGWIFFAIPVGWYFFAASHGSDTFVSRQIWFENLQRVFGNEHTNSERWWFYLPSFLRTAFPWSILFLFFAIRRMGKSSARLTVTGTPKIVWLGVIWFLSGLLLFSLAAGKRHSYLLPLFPGIALSLALWITTRLRLSLAVIASALLCIGYSVAVSVKGGLKGFKTHAELIQGIVGDAPLTVVKDPFDEYFDPILFYLKRPVEISSTAESCPGFMLTRITLFNEMKKHFPIKRVVEFGEYKEEKKIILCRCSDRF